jgi:antitoxin ParD1/3/4
MAARNVSLTPALAEFVDESVASGQFQNASEVVREGLRLLKQRQEEDRLRLERLRQEVRRGLDDLAHGRIIEVAEGETLAFVEGLKASDHR